MNRFPLSCNRRSVAANFTSSPHIKTVNGARVGRSQAGFTLIELLSVIAIIAVLAAILIPSIAGLRESANAARCVTNLRQTGIAIQAYVSDNKGTLPATGFYGVASRYTRDPRNFQNSLLNYLGLTPSDTWSTAVTDSTYSAIFDCPSFKGNFGDKCYSLQKPVASSSGTNVNPWGSLDQNGKVTTKPAKLAAILPQAKALMDYEPVTTVDPSHGSFRNVLYFDWHVGQVAVNN